MSSLLSYAPFRALIYLAYFSCISTCALVITGCSPNHLAALPKQNVAATFDIKVTDPELRNLTNVMSNVELEATGSFKEGHYLLNNTVISIPANTTFKLSLSLPIDNPAVVSTRNAEGYLWTSQSIGVNTVPVPQKILLEKGKVSAEIDLGRTLAAFMFNLLQVAPEGENLHQMVDTIQIKEAKLHLRDNSSLSIDKSKMHVGAESVIVISNLTIDKNFSYGGDCSVYITFDPDCRWIGERVDCTWEGGNSTLALKINKVGNRMVLTKDATVKKNQKIMLSNCNFRFGKLKRSNAHTTTCLIDLDELNWSHEVGVVGSKMHFLGNMNFVNTQLRIKTDVHETLANFPGKVPAILGVDIKSSGRETHFATTGPASAQEGRITVSKKDSNLVLHLGQTVLGPVDFDKLGSLHFRLEKGTAAFKQLDWSGKTSSFNLVAAGTSVLTVPDDMMIDKYGAGKTHLNMPLSLRLGSGKLKTPGGSLDLNDLNGDVLIDVGETIQLSSDLDFKLPKCPMLEGYDADVKVRGLQLTLANGMSNILLKNCTVVIPQTALYQTIVARVPKDLQFNMDKSLQKEKKWRYKNAMATHADVTNLKIEKIITKKANSLSFDASADAVVTGTIEKGSLAAMFGEGKTAHWTEKPWEIQGHVRGSGIANYKFNSSDKKNDLSYDIAMTLLVPEDVTLDWSKVAFGFLEKVERRKILKTLSGLEVPLKYSGSMDLFRNSKSVALRGLTINSVTVQPTGQDTKITFAAKTQL